MQIREMYFRAVNAAKTSLIISAKQEADDERNGDPHDLCRRIRATGKSERLHILDPVGPEEKQEDLIA